MAYKKINHGQIAMEHILSFIHTTDTSLYLNKTCPLPIEADI